MVNRLLDSSGSFWEFVIGQVAEISTIVLWSLGNEERR